MSDLDSWQALGVALAVGMMIGAEREAAKREVGSAGIRTFALAALTGAVATMVPVVVAGALLAGVVAMLAVSYWRSFAVDPGMTSESALLVTVALGALTPTEPAIAVGAGVAVAVLLLSKESLHRFLRETVTERERVDALKFFVAAFVVLPLLPDDPVGPYGVLVPQRIWLLVVFITGIGWVGYAATRALGARRGLLVAGLAGGFVSGTATTATMAAKTRQGVAVDAALAGALMASVATLVQMVAVTAVVDTEVSRRLAPAAGAGCLVLLVEAWWLARRPSVHRPTDEEDAPPETPGRPFALVPALVLAGVISGVLLLATWMTERFGPSAVSVATATGALADFHAAAVAVATLVDRGDLGLSAALVAIALGLATNTVGKLLVALAGGGPRFTGRLLLLFLPVTAAVAVGLWAALLA